MNTLVDKEKFGMEKTENATSGQTSLRVEQLPVGQENIAHVPPCNIAGSIAKKIDLPVGQENVAHLSKDENANHQDH